MRAEMLDLSQELPKVNMKSIRLNHTVGANGKLTTILFFILLFLSAPLHAMEPWVGLFFSPQANTKNSHVFFMADFEALVKLLKSKGFNTIVFDMNYGAYHFNSDVRLKRYSYPANKGLTPAEAHRMAEIVRANGMQVMVALQVLTHSVGNVFSEVYPEYMLPGKMWQAGTAFRANIDYVQFNGQTYRCVNSHTSNLINAPPAKKYWVASASDTRDPLNKAGEAVVFKMIDELIASFTVNGVKPEGFHIGCDELGWWYDNPVQSTGKSSAQIFAMVVSNAYNHIKANNPDMEVIMWGDMLDPYWYGSPTLKNTLKAIDLISKDLIIADWRYDISHTFRYDSVKQTYPSVGEYLDKGFRVWPTSWNDVKGTIDLIWTGNMEQARTGKVLGHLYSTWFGSTVPKLKLLLDDPTYQTPDSGLPGISEIDKSTFRQYYRGLADSINMTSNLINLKQCRGNNYNCGTYPRCEDNTKKDGVYSTEYRSYYCSNNVSVYNVTQFPKDYVSYWKFDGDASDVSRRNNGTLRCGATIIRDAERGNVASFLKDGAYIRVKNNALLNMGTGSLSISAWFKAGASSRLGTIVSKSPYMNNFTLFLHSNGRLLFETNGNEYLMYSIEGNNYRDNKWHHVVAVFDSIAPTINLYIDGKSSNGDLSNNNGSNIKSSEYDLLVGNTSVSGKYGYLGSIDDLMVFSRALSPTEAKLLYLLQKKLPVPKKTSDLEISEYMSVFT
jgi:hypothetical protein